MQLAYRAGRAKEGGKGRDCKREAVSRRPPGGDLCAPTHRCATGIGTSAPRPCRPRPVSSTGLAPRASSLNSVPLGLQRAEFSRPTLARSLAAAVSDSSLVESPFLFRSQKVFGPRHARAICLTGALLNFIIPRTSGTTFGGFRGERSERRARGRFGVRMSLGLGDAEPARGGAGEGRGRGRGGETCGPGSSERVGGGKDERRQRDGGRLKRRRACRSRARCEGLTTPASITTTPRR